MGIYLEEQNTDSVYTDEKSIDTVNQGSIKFEVQKGFDQDKGLISGWANVAVNADGTIPFDYDGDVILPEVLEASAIDFMLNYRLSGEEHRGLASGIVVESMVFTKEKQRCLGIPAGCVPEGWFITIKVFDLRILEKVKSGEYAMFSIQGNAKRVQV